MTVRVHPQVSIIITWKDRPILAETLRQNRPVLDSGQRETIVVNSGGDHAALQRLIDGVEIADLQIVDARLDHFNKCRSLNIGVAGSKGDVLFFLDADLLLQDDVIATAAGRLDGANFVTVRHLNESDPALRSDAFGEMELAFQMEITLPGRKTVTLETNRRRPRQGSRGGCGMICLKREHFLAVGGMNSALEGWGWEDLDLIARLQFALGLERVQAGEVIHLSHGDDERWLHGSSKAETEKSNYKTCLANYAAGNFLGTYARDVESHRRSASDAIPTKWNRAGTDASRPPDSDGGQVRPLDLSRPEVVALVPASARRVLDIGCGPGQLAGALKRRQAVEVVGIERDATAARLAREVLDQVLERDAEDPSLEFSDSPFDCVICADVLEYLPDPRSLLTRIRGWLGPDGTLVVSAANALHAKRQEATSQGDATFPRDENRGPVNAFTRRELETLLDRSGYVAEPVRFVAADGFTEWVAAGKPTRLQFGPLRVECASVGEAAEWFARSHLVVAHPAADRPV